MLLNLQVTWVVFTFLEYLVELRVRLLNIQTVGCLAFNHQQTVLNQSQKVTYERG
jgi:hypothetical protein